jgi:cytoplasmic iron level regulating protein YaaA (DUF328/UPF0246 family)
LSPAKKLDFETKSGTKKKSQPIFQKESEVLIKELRKRSQQDLKEMMNISDNLAALNAQRFREWNNKADNKNAKQALLAFNGDVYNGLQAESLTSAQLDYAQKHLFILSGLYGVLRPLDLIQAYRLEMGSKFSSSKWKSLYDFWGDKITTVINEAGDDVLVNLASQEYFKAINKKKLQMKVVTPVFKELKGEKLRVVSIFAKKARGMMIRYILENKISDPKKLKAFAEDGYFFQESLSDDSTFVFTR